MGKLLDRLDDRPWLVWLGCIAWAGLIVYLPADYDFLEWPVIALVLTAATVIGLDYLLRYAPLRDALEESGQASLPKSADKIVAGLMFASAALILAAPWYYDTWHRAALPLILSLWLPSLLKWRREAVSFMASRQAGG